MTPIARLTSLLTVLSVIAACGSGAHSQPVASSQAVEAQPVDSRATGAPVQGQPIASPDTGTPMQGQPIAPPNTGGGTAPRPIAPPSDDREPATPVAPPTDEPPAPTTRAEGVLAAHNRYRALHCTPPLRWSERIAADAQRYADRLAANGCAFEHSRSNYGENLMRFSPAGSRTPDYVVEAWYREIANYDYDRPVFGMNTGHFTQVIWAGSTELGCGVAVCNGGETWVCNYSEAGNMRGAFTENVRPVCQ